MHYSAKCGIEITCRPSVTLLDQDHIGWKSWNSATVALFWDSRRFQRQSLFSVTNCRTFLRQCGQALRLSSLSSSTPRSRTTSVGWTTTESIVRVLSPNDSRRKDVREPNQISSILRRSAVAAGTHTMPADHWCKTSGVDGRHESRPEKRQYTVHHHHHGEDGSRPWEASVSLYPRNRCRITNTCYRML